MTLTVFGFPFDATVADISSSSTPSMLLTPCTIAYTVGGTESPISTDPVAPVSMLTPVWSTSSTVASTIGGIEHISTDPVAPVSTLTPV